MELYRNASPRGRGISGVEITYRNLPHWHKDFCIQFITFHLADSLPAAVRKEINNRRLSFLKDNPQPWSDATKAEYNKLFSSLTNKYLDAGYGSCCLSKRECAHIMEQCLKHFDGERYRLHRYVVMANHVHVLVEMIGKYTISEVCKSWKNFSALNINRLLGRSGKLWHPESWDRMIRDERHYNSVVAYIEKNIRQGGILWQ
ncbi:MAG: transposase [Muribaculaceae bacterium]|nr:transposase [Muribaculaceae bacterium]